MINEELEKSKSKLSSIISMLKNSEGVLERRSLITHLQEELDTLAIEAYSDGCEGSLYYDEDTEYERNLQEEAYKRGFMLALQLSEILR